MPTALFHERSGRFSVEKTVALLAGALPALWLAGWAMAGDLGARPVSAAIHFTGLWALRFLVLSLAVTPVRRLFHWPKLILARRILGLSALAYAALHLVLFVIDQGGAQAATEIVLRIYLAIGAAALALLLALGATSTDGAIRRLGAARWNRLHQAVYAIAVLATVHFFIQSKLDVTEPVLMTGALVLLFACRVAYRLAGRLTPLGVAGLAILSALLTAGAEVLWYALATRVPPLLVAAANFSFAIGPRPAWWVLAGGLAVAVAAAIRARFVPPPRSSGRPRTAARASLV